MMSTMPMCWKCSSRITEVVCESGGVMRIVGCKEQPEIKSFEDAKTKCPLITEDEDETT